MARPRDEYVNNATEMQKVARPREVTNEYRYISTSTSYKRNEIKLNITEYGVRVQYYQRGACVTAATARRLDGETARWRDDASATRSRLDRDARTRTRPRLRRRRRPPATRRSLKVWLFGSTGASAQRVVGGCEEGVDRFVKTVLLVARGLRWARSRRRASSCNLRGGDPSIRDASLLSVSQR